MCSSDLLVAIGVLDGTQRDASNATAAPLENGAPGNLLGGLGSGLAYAGCDRLLALPDRGPNVAPYNRKVDDTTSYVPRFHTLRFALDRPPQFGIEALDVLVLGKHRVPNIMKRVMRCHDFGSGREERPAA